MATDCGSVTIESAFDSSAVYVDSCGVNREQITEGESIELTYTIANENDREAHVETDVRAGGAVQARGDFVVNPNSTETETVTFGASWGPGTYDVSVELTHISDEIPATLAAPVARSGLLGGWSPRRSREQRLFADGGQTISTSATAGGCGCGCGGSGGGCGSGSGCGDDTDRSLSGSGSGSLSGSGSGSLSGSGSGSGSASGTDRLSPLRSLR